MIWFELLVLVLMLVLIALLLRKPKLSEDDPSDLLVLLLLEGLKENPQPWKTTPQGSIWKLKNLQLIITDRRVQLTQEGEKIPLTSSQIHSILQWQEETTKLQALAKFMEN